MIAAGCARRGVEPKRGVVPGQRVAEIEAGTRLGKHFVRRIILGQIEIPAPTFFVIDGAKRLRGVDVFESSVRGDDVAVDRGGNVLESGKLIESGVIDRKSGGEGKSVDLGGRRINQKK